MNDDLKRMLELAGVPYVPKEQMIMERPEDLAVDVEDPEVATEVTLKKLAARYHRAHISLMDERDRADPAKVAARHREEDDAFSALSQLLGGPHKAVRYLLSEK